MPYRLIVNQPYQSAANVLAATFSFVKVFDPNLLRLADHWLVTPDGIAIHDEYYNHDLLIATEVADSDAKLDEPHCFSVNGKSYKLLTELPQSRLDEILGVLGELYHDRFIVTKGRNVYRLLKFVPDEVE